MNSSLQTSEFEKRASSVKKRFLEMYHRAKAGHVGCSLSCADILTFIQFYFMKEGDEIVLSKGHAAAALYSVLAEKGVISEADIATFYQDGTFLAAHPPPGKIPGIRFATGSLGHGLSLAAGIALADKMLGEDRSVFCVASDGELDEGSIWEAALFASHHSLWNLRWYIDRNRIQGIGDTEDILKLEPLRDKLEAFGWRVIETDGHSGEALFKAKEEALKLESAEPVKTRKPTAFICKTVKGRGMFAQENQVSCHYTPMTEEIFQGLMKTHAK